jgi:hypothetical protein
MDPPLPQEAEKVEARKVYMFHTAQHDGAPPLRRDDLLLARDGEVGHGARCEWLRLPRLA